MRKPPALILAFALFAAFDASAQAESVFSPERMAQAMSALGKIGLGKSE